MLDLLRCTQGKQRSKVHYLSDEGRYCPLDREKQCIDVKNYQHGKEDA